jgi:tetratricopeptide (TPR) repeat protein
LIALALGFVLFTWLLTRRSETLEDRRSNVPALIGATIAVPRAGLAWKYTEWLREFTGTEEDPLGFGGKLAAMRDAGPLIADHPLLGIGRGSYGSVYPAYKTAAHQLTYTHPENVAVQLLADWGVVLGAAAIVLLFWIIASRIRHARNVAVLGAMIGVGALALQNLVDFSLEIPGVAIPVAAILGAAGLAVVKEHRLELGGRRGLAFAAAPVVILSITTTWALSAPDLERDLETLSASAWSKDPAVLERAEEIAAGHPANAVVAARVAYAAETSDPPQLKTALRWANRTMFLAPTYADGHLVTGRLLLRFRHRRQGFTEMRRAWELAHEEQRDAIIEHIVQLSRSPDELLEAIPRRDEVMDEVDEREIAKAVVVLVRKGREDWARSLLKRIGRIESVRTTDLVRLASAAVLVDEIELAERALAKRREVDPGDDRAVLLLLEVLRKKSDVAAIAALLQEAQAHPDLDPVPFLHARLDLALKAQRVDEAREVLDEMRRRLPPTDQNQVFLARMRSQIENEDSHPAAAIRAMDDAIRLAPGNADLRVERAHLLIRLGKHERARIDLLAALRIDPQHRRAEAMLERLPPVSP